MKPFRFSREEPLLNIASHARGGSRSGERLSAAQLEQIRLTVSRAPEVMVKVLPKGSSDLNAVRKHLDYIGRQGDLALELDDGDSLQGRAGEAVLADWDLDIDALRPHSKLTALPAGRAPKLVHKLVLSMPPGTPPQKVQWAARNFAREEFYGLHRYALVLHTDEPHPHVHLVLKAISEEGVRLNVRKATLRHWRSQFADHLRQEGVAANATERAVRGRSGSALADGIYQASRRGASTFMLRRVRAVADELAGGAIQTENANRSLADTRAAVQQGWWAAAEKAAQQGERDLAAAITRFSDGLGRPQTDRERLARSLKAVTATGQFAHR